MENLKAKLKKQGGFTMVELLIVVAIIGILAAVSIPMFNNALEKARHGVDAANNRSAISLANAEAIASLKPAEEFANPVTYWYTTDGKDHQAALVSTEPADANKVKPACTNESTPYPLKVQITYTPGNFKDKPLEAFEIKTNWTIDDKTGHVSSTENVTTTP